MTGFTDAEGCFYVTVIKNKNYQLGIHVQPSFQIGLHIKDTVILHKIKSCLGVGKITKRGSNTIQLQVRSIKELKVIIDHFDKYPLITQKCSDFNFFKRVVEKIQRKEHLTLDGLRKIVAIRASMNRGLSEKVKLAFPDVVPVVRPIVENPRIPDPNWIAGFTSGEGCFYVNIIQDPRYKTGFQVKLKFQITQHSRDEHLIKSLIYYFDCGNIYKRGDAFDFKVTGLTDITHKIIPFFNKYRIHGVKAKILLIDVKLRRCLKTRNILL